MPYKVTEKEIADCIIKNKGWMTVTASELGITLKSLVHRVSKSPYLQEVRHDVQEKDLDNTEAALEELIKEKNVASILFKLKCKGGKRGWVEKKDKLILENINNTLSDIAKKLPG
jgi:hypothetical protein